MLCFDRCVFFFQAEDGIRDLVRSRGLGDVYKRQEQGPGEVLSRLLMLELKGFIKQLPGKYFVRA